MVSTFSWLIEIEPRDFCVIGKYSTLDLRPRPGLRGLVCSHVCMCMYACVYVCGVYIHTYLCVRAVQTVYRCQRRQNGMSGVLVGHSSPYAPEAGFPTEPEVLKQLDLLVSKL